MRSLIEQSCVDDVQARDDELRAAIDRAWEADSICFEITNSQNRQTQALVSFREKAPGEYLQKGFLIHYQKYRMSINTSIHPDYLQAKLSSFFNLSNLLDISPCAEPAGFFPCRLVV